MSRRPAADLVVRNASQLWCFGAEAGAGDWPDLVEDGAMAACGGTVVWIGENSALDCEVEILPGAVDIDAERGVVTPGFVDCHTHLVFAGSRADEHSARCAGESYLSLSAKGGGINATVRATRAATEEELVSLALPRLGRLLEFGVTTVEVKSGYER